MFVTCWFFFSYFIVWGWLKIIYKKQKKTFPKIHHDIFMWTVRVKRSFLRSTPMSDNSTEADEKGLLFARHWMTPFLQMTDSYKNTKVKGFSSFSLISTCFYFFLIYKCMPTWNCVYILLYKCLSISVLLQEKMRMFIYVLDW